MAIKLAELYKISKGVIVHLYNPLVRPFLKRAIHNPKGIQRIATSLVEGIRSLIYEKEVNALKKTKKLGLKGTQLFKFCRRPWLQRS